MANNSNVMKNIRVEKVTCNIGVGQSGQPLENAKTLLQTLTGRKPVTTIARVRNPVFKIKKGDPIGTKVTLRGKTAVEFLKKALDVVNNKLASRSFDQKGSFSFGVKEYIDFPGAKYDPRIGILGFDVCVTLSRPGMRIQKKRRAKSAMGKSHDMSKEDGIAFMKQAFSVECS